MAATVVTLSGPYAAGTTPTYTARLFDENDNFIPASALVSMMLTIADTLTGTIVNGCSQADILNVGRGTVDSLGNLAIVLEVGDTSMSEIAADQVSRSLVIDFAYNGGASVGRHQVNFALVRLAGL